VLSPATGEAENRHHGFADFDNVDGSPQWHEIACYCQRHNNPLREDKKTFVNDMAARTVLREPTAKQEKWLRSIFFRLGGRI
jgi:hypothetical protein